MISARGTKTPVNVPLALPPAEKHDPADRGAREPASGKARPQTFILTAVSASSKRR
jgi:hypothetical protein